MCSAPEARRPGWRCNPRHPAVCTWPAGAQRTLHRRAVQVPHLPSWRRLLHGGWACVGHGCWGVASSSFSIGCGCLGQTPPCCRRCVHHEPQNVPAPRMPDHSPTRAPHASPLPPSSLSYPLWCSSRACWTTLRGTTSTPPARWWRQQAASSTGGRLLLHSPGGMQSVPPCLQPAPGLVRAAAMARKSPRFLVPTH